MDLNFSEMIKIFSKEDKSKLLLQGNFGIELESQRITLSGDLALTPHPSVFGDKVENHRITTDFSESQIEMITPPYKSVEEVYNSLKAIRNEVTKGIPKDELLWPLSMPPKLPNEDLIPIAKFSDSEEGRDREAYRNGLAVRYGKKMQMISGIHYNFSFSEGMIDYFYMQFGKGEEKPAFINEMYLAQARNFLRYRWILIYLFGASPSCDSSYYSVMAKERKEIQQCCPDCCGIIEDLNQHATSLRVGRFGYSSTLQRKYNVLFNSLEEYVGKLEEMMATVSSEYSKLGIIKNGSKIQLNGNILQKESEFYSSIRLKQVANKEETQLAALSKRGIEYIEIRILDLNPFEIVGISTSQLRFLHVFMIFCLFQESALVTQDEFEEINSNHNVVALFGRKKNLTLRKYNKGTIDLREFGEEIFEKLIPIAELMNKGSVDGKYLYSVEKERKKLMDLSLLPSERMHREMKKRSESFLKFGIRQAVNNSKEIINGGNNDIKRL